MPVLGLPFRGLWLQAEPCHLIEGATARCDDASDATNVVREQLRGDIGALSPAGSVLDANRSAATLLERAVIILAGSVKPLVQVL